VNAWAALSITLAIGAATLGAIGIVLQAVTLPGTWIVVLAAASVKVHDLFAPGPLLSWWTFLAIVGLAVVAEIAETLAGAAGAKTGGASRRGMIGAIVGSLAGAVLGTIFLLPIVGSLIGAVAGAAIGAIVGELSGGGRTLRETAAPAAGAVAGRLAGAFLKTGFATVMWLALVIGLVR
jgi:uncharacterized protein YqgC (DUF456 family)